MKPGKRRFLGVSGAIALGALALGVRGVGAETFPCAAEDGLEREIATDAEVVDFTCFFDDYKDVRSLHFKVDVRNTSDQPQRYRVNIFLDNGKAVGGLLPAKGSPPAVQPGETASFTYPVQAMEEKPREVTLIVKTISP